MEPNVLCGTIELLGGILEFCWEQLTMGCTTQKCQATDTLISSVEFLLTISFRTLTVVASWV